MSEKLLARAVMTCAGRAEVEVATARFGADYIATEGSFALAAHSALDAWASAIATPRAVPDAVLIACFGDPGLFALRELSSAPVTGLADASFRRAAALGRFAIVTGGAAWSPILERVAAVAGHSHSLAGIRTVEATGAELAARPDLAQTLLLQACRDAAQIEGVQSVILGGAGLAGMAHQLQPHLQVPLIDSVDAGVEEALTLAPTRRTPKLATRNGNWTGISLELTRLAMQTG